MNKFQSEGSRNFHRQTFKFNNIVWKSNKETAFSYFFQLYQILRETTPTEKAVRKASTNMEIHHEVTEKIKSKFIYENSEYKSYRPLFDCLNGNNPLTQSAKDILKVLNTKEIKMLASYAIVYKLDNLFTFILELQAFDANGIGKKSKDTTFLMLAIQNKNEFAMDLLLKKGRTFLLKISKAIQFYTMF